MIHQHMWWKGKYNKIIQSAFLITYLLLAFLMLVTVSRLPGGMGNQKHLLLVLLLILSAVGLAFFIFHLSAANTPSSLNSNEAAAESLLNGAESVPEVKAVLNKKGRLIKKLRRLMAATDLTDLHKLAETNLSAIAAEVNIVQGVFYIREKDTGIFNPYGKYAWYSVDPPMPVSLGESLAGQVAKDQKMLHVPNVPENYIKILSGLGSSNPRNLYILPVVNSNYTYGIIELATFKELDPFSVQLIHTLAEHIASIIEELSIQKNEL